MISYKGLEKARAERAAKEAAKEAKKAERKVKKAEKESKKAAKEVEEVASATLEVQEATTGKKKLDQKGISRKGKSPEGAGAPEPKAKVMRLTEAQVEEDRITPELWRAPVAKMW